MYKIQVSDTSSNIERILQTEICHGTLEDAQKIGGYLSSSTELRKTNIN